MRSEASFFNRTFFALQLRRFWPIAALHALAVLLALPLRMVRSIASADYSAESFRYFVFHTVRGYSVLVSVVFSVAAACAVLLWLYNDRSAAYTTALPVSRRALFGSSVLAGAALLFVGNVLAFLVSAAVMRVNAIAGFYALLTWLGAKCLLDIAFYGFAVFCGMLTGNVLILPIAFVIFQSAAVALQKAGQYLLGRLVWGLGFQRNGLLAASPLVRLLTGSDFSAPVFSEDGLVIGYTFTAWHLLSVYALVGALFTLLAWLIFRIRKMETAGDVVAIPVLKPVFRVCMAVAGGLGLAVAGGYMLFNIHGSGNAGAACAYLVLLLLGGAAGWMTANTLIYKSFRAVLRHAKGFGVYAAVVLTLVVLIRADITGFEKRVPDRAEIASASLSAGNTCRLSDERNIDAVAALHKRLIAHEAEHTRGPLPRWDDRQDLWITYYDASGAIILQRRYLLERDDAEGSDIRLAEDILNTPEAILLRKRLSLPVSAETMTDAYLSSMTYDSAAVELTPSEALELYNECILPDMRDGTIGRVWLVSDDRYYRECMNTIIGFDLCRTEFDPVTGERTESRDYFFTYPTAYSLRTLRWLSEHGYFYETIESANQRVYSESR